MNLPPLEPCEQMFPYEEFGITSKLLNEFGQGNDPIALMLTCWELGGAPDKVSNANPGEIMVVQNPGGLISSRDIGNAGMQWGSIIHGLSYSSVRHLIVCGHTDCKTLGLLLGSENQRPQNPFRNLLEPIDAQFQATYNDRPSRDWLDLIVQVAILQQLANLRSHSEVRNRLQNGKLLLHGWIRDDQTSAITAYDPLAGQFCV